MPTLTYSDHPGARRFRNQAEAERSARLRLEAFEARNKTYYGESTMRTLAPGTTFLLTEHAVHDADRRTDGALRGGMNRFTEHVRAACHLHHRAERRQKRFGKGKSPD